MTDKQPDALRLADVLDLLWLDGKTPQQAAAELRRLHAELAEPDALREKMSDILRRTARHKPADELQRLQGEARVMRGLLRQCAEVLCTVEPKSDTEGEELYALLHGIQGVIEPKAKGALL